jgi:hypothetical protein
MNSLSDAPEHKHRDEGSHSSDTSTEAQVDARLRMESMSRVACALIFQSARDLVCAQRTEGDALNRRPKAVRQARLRIEEIALWARTIHPLVYESGGITLAGAVETINVQQDYRGGRRIEYWVVRQLLLREPHRLAVVDGPAEFRTLTSESLVDPLGSETLNPDSSDDLLRVIDTYQKEIVPALPSSPHGQGQVEQSIAGTTTEPAEYA